MELRQLAPSDVPACEAIALEHGWEVGEERWRLMLGAGQGWGCFDGGALVGTTLLLAYESRVSLVAMVLVRKAFGRQGVGRRLVERAVSAAPRSVYLYATEQGRRLYERMGFVASEGLARFTGTPRDAAAGEPAELRPLVPSDLPAAVALDAESFGASREPVLSALYGSAVRSLGAFRDGRLCGFGIATRLREHVMLGPVAAVDEPSGVQIVRALARHHALPIRFDSPASRTALRDWALGAGLAQDPPVPLMALDGRALPGRRERMMAVASRGLG